MRYNFKGSNGLEIQIGDKRIPLELMKFTEIRMNGDPETITIRGNGLTSHKELRCKELVRFDGQIYDGDEMVVDMNGITPVDYTQDNDGVDEVEFVVDYWTYGSSHISLMIGEIHRKNMKTWEETRPDYGDCYE